MAEEKGERELAKCEGFDLSIEERGVPVLSGHFAYEGGGCQGFGYVVDAAFLVRLMEAVGATSLTDIRGKSCWVTHTHSNISKIEPLHKKDGTAFDIAAWSAWHRINGKGQACPLREK